MNLSVNPRQQQSQPLSTITNNQRNERFIIISNTLRRSRYAIVNNINVELKLFVPTKFLIDGMNEPMNSPSIADQNFVLSESLRHMIYAAAFEKIYFYPQSKIYEKFMWMKRLRNEIAS
jgi:hypothetical protein